jgi:hypothetical protein
MESVLIPAFPLRKSREEAESGSAGRGGWLGRIATLNRPPSSVRLYYIEFRLLTLRAIHKPGILNRLLGHGETKEQRIRLIADGTCGATALAEGLPLVEEVKVDPEQVQESSIPEETFERRACKTALRILRRHVGGFPEISLESVERIYRPYWMCFYGELREGRKVRYVPVPADGCSMRRTF